MEYVIDILGDLIVVTLREGDLTLVEYEPCEDEEGWPCLDEDGALRIPRGRFVLQQGTAALELTWDGARLCAEDGTLVLLEAPPLN